MFPGGCAPTAVSSHHTGPLGQLDHRPWSDRGQTPKNTMYFHLSCFVMIFKVKKITLTVINLSVGESPKIDKQHCVVWNYDHTNDYDIYK